MNNTIYLRRFEVTNLYQYGLLTWGSSKAWNRQKKFTLENGLDQKYIPDGTYELEFREATTPLTEKYQRRFKWFNYHIWVKNVPNANWVYMHIGNTQLDTDACITVQNTCDLTPPTIDGFNGESEEAFKELYLKVQEYKSKEKKLYLNIKTINH